MTIIKPIIRKVILKLKEFQKQASMLSQFGRRTPFQILISTVLSARTKDTTTIPICKVLFAKYPDAEHLVKANLSVLKMTLYGIGFYNVKAQRIKDISRILLDKFNGQVPKTLNSLLSLPGVGRKTANCVLVYAFRKPAIPVDVHVHRIANRLGWSNTKTPEESEQALMKLVPKNLWVDVNEHFVVHGQTICTPTSPFCSKCPIMGWCKKVGVVKSR